jgi:myo-inositol-1-phosphate synthase
MEVTTDARIPRIGLMLVGIGGNNGTTLAGMLLANKHEFTWHTKTGIEKSNFLGSVSQVGTIPVGLNGDGQEIFVPIRSMVTANSLNSNDDLIDEMRYKLQTLMFPKRSRF